VERGELPQPAVASGFACVTLVLEVGDDGEGFEHATEPRTELASLIAG
jgi:hypothetical protein